MSLVCFVAPLRPLPGAAENVVCDPTIDPSEYYCRGWQDGVGKYGSRVRFIARILGDDNGDDLGGAVVPLGDINNDSRGDFMVWVKNKCEWRIFRGDSVISKTPVLVWPKGSTPYPCSPSLGSFASIADISGDGEPDLLRSRSTTLKSIDVYFAGSAFDTLPDLTISEPDFVYAGAGGHNYAGGRDLNGDGHPDLVVPDYGYFQETPQRSGRLYIFWGGTALDSVPDLILTDTSWVGQNQPTPLGGGPIALHPSLNGDLVADLLVGRPSSNLLTKDPPGRVYVFHGGSSMDTIRDFYFEGPDTFHAGYCGYLFANYFGGLVEVIGDVNQDGYEDIFVSGGGCVPGYLYYGGPSFDTAVDLRTTSSWPEEQGGSINSAALVGDVNGDGFDDFATVMKGDQLLGGWVRVHYSSPNPTGAADWIVAGDDWAATAGEFGRATVALGDVDGDGYDDFAIGTKTSDEDETNRGAVYVFAGHDPDIYSGVFDDGDAPLPTSHALVESIYPNPFNAGTTIRLAGEGWAGSITIYDILGRAVRVFGISHTRDTRIVWDGRDSNGRGAASGLYFAKAQSGPRVEVKKLVHLK